jgi:hypothetical protein
VTPAVEAAVRVGARFGLPGADPVVLSDGANTLVHLRPAPVVARVATLTRLLRPDVVDWFAREVDLVSFLAGEGAPVVPPSDVVPPGPHLVDALAVSFWRYVCPVPRDDLTPGTVGALLRDLHAVLRRYPEPLPYLGTPLSDLERFFAGTTPVSTVDSAGLATLRAAFDRLVPLVRDRGPAQPLHGDAHPGNLIPTADGWLWGDFEDACAGPVQWDLACLARTRRLDGRAALAAYGVVPDDAELAPFVALRRLHGTVWWLLLAEHFPAHRTVAAQRLAEWRAG